MVKNPLANVGDTGDVDSIHGWEDPLEEEMANYSSILAGKIPWTEEPGGLQSMALQRVGYDRAHTHILISSRFFSVPDQSQECPLTMVSGPILNS